MIYQLIISPSTTGYGLACIVRMAGFMHGLAVSTVSTMIAMGGRVGYFDKCGHFEGSGCNNTPPPPIDLSWLINAHD